MIWLISSGSFAEHYKVLKCFSAILFELDLRQYMKCDACYMNCIIKWDVVLCLSLGHDESQLIAASIPTRKSPRKSADKSHSLAVQNSDHLVVYSTPRRQSPRKSACESHSSPVSSLEHLVSDSTPGRQSPRKSASELLASSGIHFLYCW